ncbi:MAG: hypothetical protein ACI94D_000380 [Neolewinella sp.]|jgi:hypothetical protein
MVFRLRIRTSYDDSYPCCKMQLVGRLPLNRELLTDNSKELQRTQVR